MQLVRNFWQSQVGKKVVMAVTGLIGVGFVVGHMVGNLQVFEGPAKINAYAHFLHHTMGELLWPIRAVLLTAVILHVVAAVQLTRQKQAARPGRQAYVKWEPQISTFASRTIRWGGALLLVWLVYHILHFTIRPQITSPGYSDTDVYSNIVKGFSRPLVTAFYLVAMASLALHLFHGAWSSMRTLGISRPRARPTARPVALLVAAVVALGFAVVPLAVLLGVVKPATVAPAPNAQAPRPGPVGAQVSSAAPVPSLPVAGK
jgi:succinate dehydrogenase / fumarate reductase cytochrome b subunit